MSAPVPRTTERLRAWLRPAPDSIAGCAVRRGRPLWTEFVHLLWTMWVFIVPVFTPQGYNPLWWALTLVSYPLFVALYVRVLLAPRRRVRLPALGMMALCLVLLRWYPSGMSYFIFGCIFLGFGPWRSWWGYPLALLALNVLFVLAARAFGYPWTSMVWMPVTTLAVGVVVQSQRVLERKDQALELSQEEVRRLAATAERERIGRDLHDLLGHTLSLVALKADLAGKLLPRDPQAAQREIGELAGIAREALAQVRRAVSGIRSAEFAAELAAARLLLGGERIDLQVHRNDASALAPELETVLALCLREAVTNVHRHARARQVGVSLAAEGGRCRLLVEDDGRGGAIRPGNGLAGMRERVHALGGRVRWEPAQPRGTRLVVEVPLREAVAPQAVDAPAAAGAAGAQRGSGNFDGMSASPHAP
ncbi:sensor histidine kinase [Pseudoxanthomonas sp. SGT-18]|uniref:sensor histidine kinase n=1 Tax=Pseudoxanthomonas sp. SGT-18 TaxID=2493087 RepID=UPI000F62A7ED|nr:sensor histidine kinase [Pseudoxanthomonas sp. SGT-18]